MPAEPEDTLQILRATTSEDVADVKSLFLSYLTFVTEYLGQDLSFQGTEKEFAQFPQTYTALYLAKKDSIAVGAVGLKLLRPEVIELKRLYVAPNGRGLNLGEKLSQAVINEARRLGYTYLYLDTDPGLTHANALYEKLEFEDIPQYYDNPLADQSRYMRLAL